MGKLKNGTADVNMDNLDKMKFLGLAIELLKAPDWAAHPNSLKMSIKGAVDQLADSYSEL